jgi:hypothetical protein
MRIVSDLLDVAAVPDMSVVQGEMRKSGVDDSNAIY